MKWRIFTVDTGEDERRGLDRGGEVRLLHHLLETSHLSLYSQVYPGDEVSVFLTLSEIWSLASHFSMEERRDQEEMIIYSAQSDNSRKN